MDRICQRMARCTSSRSSSFVLFSLVLLYLLSHPAGSGMRRLSFCVTNCANNYAAHRRPKTSLARRTPARGNLKGDEEADVAAKEFTGCRRVREWNGKWRKRDSGHIVERHTLAGAISKLAPNQKLLDCGKKPGEVERREENFTQSAQTYEKGTRNTQKSL